MFHGGGGGPHHHGGGGGRFDQDEMLGKVYDSRVIARLPRFIKPVLKLIGVGAFGMLVRTLATLAIPYMVGVAIDHIDQGQLGDLNITIFVLVGIAVAMWGGQYLESLFTAFAGQKIIYKMRTDMFDHLHRLSLGFFDNQQVGKLMSRVQNDVAQLQELVTQGMLALITSVLTLIGIAIIILTMNLKLGLLTLTVVPVLMIGMFIWQKFARKAFIRVRRAIAVVNSQLQEDMSGVRVVQSLSREDENMEQFDEINKAHLDANVTAVKLEALMMPTVNIMTGVSFAIVIIVGGFQVMDGVMKIGALMAFLLYVQRFFDPVLELSMQYTELQRAMASGSRIFEMLDIKPEIQDAPDAIDLPPVNGEITFKDVNFAYEEDKDVLHDINLTIKPGETVAIVGQTGSGKSSLVSLTARFYEVKRGAVLVDGHDVRDVTQHSLRKQIGIVPQDPILFTGSIEENIKFGNPDLVHEQVEEVAKAVGAHAFISRLKKGYETEVGQRGSNLSAGQRQLICMARAILADPRILILDEATSNIDTHTERIMQRALKKLARGRTCLTIAHRLSTVTGADRIIVMDHGKIIEEGSHKALLAMKGHYHELYTTLSSPDLAT
ncbi:MAG: ABC transporter ATP-binding protein/permease [Dehalococcoidales bacterium]|nr:ABC transporter ATP-binding protein/permease [Dehalococcoidales bacterium]